MRGKIMYTNKTTKKIAVGNTFIGGGSPITVQSMLSRPAHDIEGNIAQALELQGAGCEIIRVSVPDTEAVKTVYAPKNQRVLKKLHNSHRSTARRRRQEALRPRERFGR